MTPWTVASVHGILQARILEWVAISFSRGSSWPRDRPQVSHIAGRFFIIWANTTKSTNSVLVVQSSSRVQLFVTPGLQHNQTQNNQSNWKRNIKLEALHVLISKYYKARMIKVFPCVSAGTESTCIAGNLGSLVSEDPQEKGKAIHSSIPAWRIPWTI